MSQSEPGLPRSCQADIPAIGVPVTSSVTPIMPPNGLTDFDNHAHRLAGSQIGKCHVGSGAKRLFKHQENISNRSKDFDKRIEILHDQSKTTLAELDAARIKMERAQTYA